MCIRDRAVLKALLHVAQDHLISVAFEQHQTRVHDILARRTPVYELARVIRKHFLEGLQKRDNRNGALVELADRGQIKQIGIGVLVNNVGLFLRNHAEDVYKRQRKAWCSRLLATPGQDSVRPSAR